MSVIVRGRGNEVCVADCNMKVLGCVRVYYKMRDQSKGVYRLSGWWGDIPQEGKVNNLDKKR